MKNEKQRDQGLGIKDQGSGIKDQGSDMPAAARIARHCCPAWTRQQATGNRPARRDGSQPSAVPRPVRCMAARSGEHCSPHAPRPRAKRELKTPTFSIFNSQFSICPERGRADGKVPSLRRGTSGVFRPPCGGISAFWVDKDRPGGYD